MNRYGELIKLFNQRKMALLSQEFLDLRDATIGPQPLCALIDAGFPIEALHALHSEAYEDYKMFLLLHEYITQLALGDAICRWRGDLPPETFVPRDALAGLREITPTWGIVFNHVERELKKGGILADDPTWAKDYVKGQTWRTRLEAALSQLHKELFRVAQGIMRSNQVLGNNLITFAANEEMEEALALVKPLEPHFVASVESSPIGGPTRGHHEALRQRGAAVLSFLGRRSRDRGNALYKAANAEPPGERRITKQRQAVDAYMRADEACDEISLISACNAAAVTLALKDWQNAKVFATSAVNQYLMRMHTPHTFSGMRANVILALRSGNFMELPFELQRAQTKVQIDANKELQRKAYIRLGRAHAGHCQQILDRPVPSDAMQTWLEARTQLNLAKEAFKNAVNMQPEKYQALNELDPLMDAVDEYGKLHCGPPRPPP